MQGLRGGAQAHPPIHTGSASWMRCSLCGAGPFRAWQRAMRNGGEKMGETTKVGRHRTPHSFPYTAGYTTFVCVDPRAKKTVGLVPNDCWASWDTLGATWAPDRQKRFTTAHRPARPPLRERRPRGARGAGAGSHS